MSGFKDDVAQLLAFKSSFDSFKKSIEQRIPSTATMDELNNKIDALTAEVEALKSRPENDTDTLESLHNEIASARKSYGEQLGLVTKQIRGLNDGE